MLLPQERVASVEEASVEVLRVPVHEPFVIHRPYQVVFLALVLVPIVHLLDLVLLQRSHFDVRYPLIVDLLLPELGGLL